MKNLTITETKSVSGGTRSLELEIPQGFRLLIEAIEEYASFPKEFAQVLENRVQSLDKSIKSTGRRPRSFDT